MEIEELLEYLIINVPNFETPELIGEEGDCSHYTENWDLINKYRGFKGAPIDKIIIQDSPDVKKR
jgi:hypothetical protein